MDYSFSINTKKGGTLIVSLLSSYDFLAEVVNQDRLTNIEIIDISITRETGNSVIMMDVLKMIATQILRIMEDHPNAILFYFCDSSTPIPIIRSTRNISDQGYRDKLFSLMFRRYGNLYNSNWNDYRIETTVDHKPQFAHLLYRDKHKGTINDISKEILNTITEIDHQK